MFKRLIHPEIYDAGMADLPDTAHPHQQHYSSQLSPWQSSLKAILNNIQVVSILMSFLIFAILIYAIVEMVANQQTFKQEMGIIQGQLKKLHSSMHDAIEEKHLSYAAHKNGPLTEVLDSPDHLKYMGLFKSGAVQKALIETDQGSVLFTHQQMLDQQWRLKQIYEDRLVLESITGQQTTLYKELSHE